MCNFAKLYESNGIKTCFKHIFAVLAATVALAACNKEITSPNFENDEVNPAAEGSRVITVSFVAQTKTYLDTSGFQPKFADGDSILISNGDTVDTCRVKVEGDAATISTDLDGPLTAAYPAKFVKVRSGKIKSIKVLSVQSGKFSDANICYAEMGENDSSLHFENAKPILKFYVDKSIGVKSIKITSSAEEISDDDLPYTITVVAPEGKTLYDVMPSEGQDRRICYVALGGKDVTFNTLTFESETTTQEKVTRAPTKYAMLEPGYMYSVFLPYCVKVKVSDNPETYQSWGYCNVGAFLPEEPGKYFAWGDKEGQAAATSGEGAFTKEFSWANAPFNDGSSTYDGTYFSSQRATVCPGDVLAQEYDAANANWGNGWRMPTKEEFQVLYDACGGSGSEYTLSTLSSADPDKDIYWLADTQTHISDYAGVAGLLFVDGSKNKLFFPAAGNGFGTSLIGADARSYYWSSTLHSSPGSAYDLLFNSGTSKVYPQNSDNRCYGFSIRPIYSPAPAPAGPEFVEMKMGTDPDDYTLKWATMNLGATTVADSGETCFGDYYAWGETVPYYKARSWNSSDKKWEDVTWNEGKTGGYCWQSYCGQEEFKEWSPVPYNDTTKILKDDYDVVKKAYPGTDWRMPTSQEFKDLYDACGGTSNPKSGGSMATTDKGVYWCTDYDGVAGLLFCDGTHKLFFPAAGLGSGTGLSYAGSGSYCSSSLSTSDTNYAYNLCFDSGNVYPQYSGIRYAGSSVRPVSE